MESKRRKTSTVRCCLRFNLGWKIFVKVLQRSLDEVKNNRGAFSWLVSNLTVFLLAIYSRSIPNKNDLFVCITGICSRLLNEYLFDHRFDILFLSSFFFLISRNLRTDVYSSFYIIFFTPFSSSCSANDRRVPLSLSLSLSLAHSFTGEKFSMLFKYSRSIFISWTGIQ